MSRDLLCIYGPDEHTGFGTYPSRGARPRAFAGNGVLNETLRIERRLITADSVPVQLEP